MKLAIATKLIDLKPGPNKTLLDNVLDIICVLGTSETPSEEGKDLFPMAGAEPIEDIWVAVLRARNKVGFRYFPDLHAVYSRTEQFKRTSRCLGQRLVQRSVSGQFHVRSELRHPFHQVIVEKRFPDPDAVG